MTRQSINLTDELVQYIINHNPTEHEALVNCREDAANHPRGHYQISPEQGSFMGFLVRMLDARIAVEIGVFTGYSALVTALALTKNAGPGARLFALDISHEYLKLAQKYWQMAQVEKYITPMQGEADQSVEKLLEMGYEGKVDFVFIDADKAKYPLYYELGLRLMRKSGVMVFDNMLREGRVINPAEDDKISPIINELNAFAQTDKRVEACLVGIGDGLLMCKKR